MPFFITILIFDILWCLTTTFRGMSDPNTYVNALLLALILSLPALISRRRWVSLILLLLLDILLICNLMYCRTYMSAIPLHSYLLAGNLADFQASVFDSLRWYYILLPLYTLIWYFWAYRYKPRWLRFSWRRYVITLALTVVASASLMLAQGGFIKRYTDMLNSCYYSSCTTTAYTIAGNLIYDWISSSSSITPEQQQLLDDWFADRNRLDPLLPLPADSMRMVPKSLVIILLESFENWLLNTEVEGQVLTPNLNALLADSTTLYAPHVVTQVGPGRSIEAQLLINAGLLPMLSTVYSMQYSQRQYHTLTKALAQRSDSTFHSYLLSPDKPYVWNQGVIAHSFGIDSLIMQDAWNPSSITIGSGKGKIPDAELCQQIVDKMSTGEIWPVGSPAFVQIVTYSGHNPFILPDNLKELSFSDTIPQRMADYMTMARYTDSSLAPLIEYLKSRSDFDQTLIVITGDHEGLAGDRAHIISTPAGRRYVDSEQLTPLIILNSPVPMRYDYPMGQVDIYSTLLDLLQLYDYPWHGLGQSILQPTKLPVAINTMSSAVIGDTIGVDPRRFELLRQARQVSDLIISHY